MKSLLMYNYNFENPVIWQIDYNFYIKENGETYIFKPISLIDTKLLDEANKDKTYYNVLKNREDNYLTNYKNTNYILIKINKDVSITEENFYSFLSISSFFSSSSFLIIKMENITI